MFSIPVTWQCTSNNHVCNVCFINLIHTYLRSHLYVKYISNIPPHTHIKSVQTQSPILSPISLFFRVHHSPPFPSLLSERQQFLYPRTLLSLDFYPRPQESIPVTLAQCSHPSSCNWEQLVLMSAFTVCQKYCHRCLHVVGSFTPQNLLGKTHYLILLWELRSREVRKPAQSHTAHERQSQDSNPAVEHHGSCF